jgi:hypothetical protein
MIVSCAWSIADGEGLDIAGGGERQEGPMKSLKRRFSAAPEGTAVLFFIQIFCTLGFAVLYSTFLLR